jgi:hypothetical protein
VSRLPTPGSDNGIWGDVLNDFLSVEHNTDGTLKASGSLSTKANDSAVVHNTSNETVAGIKTFSSSPIVPAPSTNTQAANKVYVDTVASAGAPDATTSTKGIVQLTNDLAGTATAPTVPGLANKADKTITISAGTGLTGGGDLSTNRTLTVSNDTTIQKVEVAKDGTLVGSRRQVNFITGANTTLTVTDNGGSNRVDVTVAAAAGATQPKVRTNYFKAGDIPFPNTSSAWQALLNSGNRYETSIPAANGDWVEISISGLMNPVAGANYIDIGVMVSTSFVRFLSSGTGTPALEGEPGVYPQTTNFRPMGYGTKGFTVTSGDLDSGNVRFVVAVNAVGTGTFYSSTNYPFYMRAANLGVVA